MTISVPVLILGAAALLAAGFVAGVFLPRLADWWDDFVAILGRWLLYALLAGMVVGVIYLASRA